jgi:hypothetical protein
MISLLLATDPCLSQNKMPVAIPATGSFGDLYQAKDETDSSDLKN